MSFPATLLLRKTLRDLNYAPRTTVCRYVDTAAAVAAPAPAVSHSSYIPLARQRSKESCAVVHSSQYSPQLSEEDKAGNNMALCLLTLCIPRALKLVNAVSMQPRKGPGS